MKGKKYIKRIVLVAVCASVLVSFATISNAVTINDGSSEFLLTDYVYSGVRTYEYKVSYIYYNGLAVGAYIPGLTVYADYDHVCDVDTSSDTGPYWINSSGYHDYRLYNDTGKDVTITFNLKRH